MGGCYGSECGPNRYHAGNNHSIMLLLVFRIHISPGTGGRAVPLGIQDILITTLQLLLTSGVGTVFIINYAINGIYVREEMPVATQPRFASDYDELMWLAERQKHHFDSIETKRLYQLRHNWPKMHSFSYPTQGV